MEGRSEVATCSTFGLAFISGSCARFYHSHLLLAGVLARSTKGTVPPVVRLFPITVVVELEFAELTEVAKLAFQFADVIALLEDRALEFKH